MESYVKRHFKIDVMEVNGKPMICVVKTELTAFNDKPSVPISSAMKQNSR